MMFIQREEAVQVLYNLINSGILKREYEDALEEIATCIEKEGQGLHMWGAEDDAVELFVAYRKDLLTDEVKKKIKDTQEKYSFSPSPFEEDVFNENE